MNNKRKKQLGMTLIEVLIASLVLFIAIGTISGVYRTLNHYQRLSLVDYALMLNQRSFVDYLSYAIGEKQYSGTYEAGQYEIVWEAELIQNGGVINGWNPETASSSSFSAQGVVSLFNVTFHFESFSGKRFEITHLVVNEETKPRL